MPAVNLDVVNAAPEISLATPAAQTVVPLVTAVARVADVLYSEVATTLSTASRDAGARAELDEMLGTTAAALRTVGAHSRRRRLSS